MLGSAIIYSAIMLGPWGELKTAAFSIGSERWWLFAVGFLLINFILLPGLFYGAVRLSQPRSVSRTTTKLAFKSYSAALVPLGLGAWAAFSLSFAFSNGSYIWGVISDPLGWGWNLLGTAGYSWTPYLSSLTPKLEAAVLIAGLLGSGQIAAKISREDNSQNALWPLLIFFLGITIGLLWLLVG
jgi:hypothetical protein